MRDQKFRARPTHFYDVGHQWPRATAPKQRPYLGIELELEFRVGAQVTEAVWAGMLRLTAEHRMRVCGDASLANGVEFVSDPATLAWWRAHRRSVKAWLSRLRAAGAVVRPSCGLHVHLNRRAFPGRVHEARAAASLLALPLPAERAVARRERYPKPSLAELMMMPMSRKDVRLTRSTKGTFELRHFRATLDVDELFAALELAHLMWDAVQGSPPTTMTTVPLLAAARAKAKSYPALTACWQRLMIAEDPPEDIAALLAPPRGYFADVDDDDDNLY